MRFFVTLLAAFALAGCQQSSQPTEDSTAEESTEAMAEESQSATLAAVLDAQPEEFKARYQFRNPQETLEFFGIEPGMVVVEGLPGRGWYTKLLLPYLGSEGCLIGANYQVDMWQHFAFGTPEFVETMRNWTEDWPVGAEEWRGDAGAEIRAFIFGSMPEDYAGTADVVFFPRVMHNLANFQNAGHDQYLATAIADAFASLKPGGVFGVVQHQARDEMSDEFADGSHGYLKQDWLIAQIEAAGFEFVASSDINQNSADQPGEEDIVWRLPPSFATSGEDEELRAQYEAVGESNRMTLKFRKPM